jgi:hypothetical protein
LVATFQRLVLGRIIWAEIADSNGFRKLRPAHIGNANHSGEDWRRCIGSRIRASVGIASDRR